MSWSKRAVLLVTFAVGLTCAVRALAEEDAGPPGANASRPLAFGAFPHHSLMQLEAFYAPLAQKLGEVIGRPVRFGTSSTHQRFQKRLEKRDFDMALVTAGDYVERARSAGYEPLLRLVGANLVVLATQPASTAGSIKELRGKRVAVAPEDGRFLQIVKELLRAHGLDPARDVVVQEVPDHNACVEHLASGRSDVCATTAQALAFSGAREGESFKIVGRGEMEFPPLVVVSSTMSAADRKAIVSVLTKWVDESSVRGGLHLVPATDTDYARFPANEPTANAGDDGLADAGLAGGR